MNSERGQLIREMYAALLELPAAERAAFLDSACGDDLELRREVERLLAGEPLPAGVLETAPLDVVDRRPEGVEPQRLGQFDLQECIGRGGMGVVYRATDRALMRTVAIKLLPSSLLVSERDIERIQREARASARLAHPGIVAIHSVGREQDTHYFVMELVEGHDLGEEIKLQRAAPDPAVPTLLPRERKLYLREVMRVVADAADALSHAHAHGVVHRDVKPANLLLDRHGNIKVADFGLARDEAQGQITRSGEGAGSAYYMSPEQARFERRHIDQRTDVYSLGVVLYELLTLRRPYEGHSNLEVISKILRSQPPALRRLCADLPRNLETICEKAMAKELVDRYPDAAALRDDLRRELAGRAIVARPLSLLERARRWSRYNRMRVAAALLVVVATAAGAVTARTVAAQRALAKLSFDAVDESGAQVAGSLVARRIDDLTGSAGPPRALGRLPLERAHLQPGYYRLVARFDDGSSRECTRTLAGDVETSVRVALSEASTSLDGMVLIEGGVLALDELQMTLSPLNGHPLLIEPFWLDESEVSNASYREFLEATGHPAPRHWADLDPVLHADLPVVYVSWLDARAFAEWAGKRLPTLGEWMWAARGPERRLYPWSDAQPGELRGNVLRPRSAVSNSQGLPVYFASAEPVRSHPEACTASGLFHTFGNVEEWTESPFAEKVGETFEPRPARRLYAATAWDAGTVGYTLAAFGHEGIESSYANFKTGFRCARSITP